MKVPVRVSKYLYPGDGDRTSMCSIVITVEIFDSSAVERVRPSVGNLCVDYITNITIVIINFS